MRRREFVASTVAGTAALAGCLGSNSETAYSDVSDGPTVGTESLVGGLNQPLDVRVFADGDRWYIADKVGTIHIREGGTLREKPVLDLTDQLAEIEFWEQGLLGIELHPDFETNRKLYVRYSAPLRADMSESLSHTFVLSEFRVSRDYRTADPATERELLALPQPSTAHQSGNIRFGPDGYLYVATGNGGVQEGDGVAEDWYRWNRGGNGQDVTENLLGGILRIDVDRQSGDEPYAIPEGNPLVGRDGLDEYYAWGFRNPWGMTFDRDQLIVADVGPSDNEEVNVVTKGGNYGWNVKAGVECNDNVSLGEAVRENPLNIFRPIYLVDAVSELTPYQKCPDSTPDGNPLRDPVIVYPHDVDGEPFGLAVIGGHVRRTGDIPELDGKYLFADLSGRLFVSDLETDDTEPVSMEELRVRNSENGRLNRRILAISQGPDGGSYLLTSRFREKTGEVLELTS